MTQSPQELTPLQKDVVMLHSLALGNLVTADTIELPGGYIAQSHKINGIELRHHDDPKEYLLQIVGPPVPKPNTRNTTQSIVRWKETAPEGGIFEIRETTESHETVTEPVIFPETKEQIIDTLSKLLVKGFSLDQTDEKP